MPGRKSQGDSPRRRRPTGSLAASSRTASARRRWSPVTEFVHLTGSSMYKRRRLHAGTQWASLQQGPEHIRCLPCSRPLFWPLYCCEQQNTRAHSATKALIRDLASTCASIQARAGAQPANGAHSLVRHDFAMLALNRSRAHTGGVDAQLNQVFAAVEQEKHVSRYPLPISQRRTTRANLPSSPIRTKSPDQCQQSDFQLWDMQGSEHRRFSARDRTF